MKPKPSATIAVPLCCKLAGFADLYYANVLLPEVEEDEHAEIGQDCEYFSNGEETSKYFSAKLHLITHH